jgi:hypothetical protein
MLKQCRRIVGWFGVANDRLHPEVGPPNLLLSSLRQPGDQWVKPADMSILCGHAKTWPHFPSTPTAPSISTSQRKPIHRANARMSLWRNIESDALWISYDIIKAVAPAHAGTIAQNTSRDYVSSHLTSTHSTHPRSICSSAVRIKTVPAEALALAAASPAIIAETAAATTSPRTCSNGCNCGSFSCTTRARDRKPLTSTPHCQNCHAILTLPRPFASIHLFAAVRIDPNLYSHVLPRVITRSGPQVAHVLFVLSLSLSLYLSVPAPCLCFCGSNAILESQQRDLHYMHVCHAIPYMFPRTNNSYLRLTTRRRHMISNAFRIPGLNRQSTRQRS